MTENHADVGVVMGSKSDWKVMEHCVNTLKQMNIKFRVQVVSAHRTPDLLYKYAEDAAKNGLKVIIAGAGGAAHLPGMMAAKTELPVLGVPIPTQNLSGQDSLFSIVQMPAGVPVATFAIGKAGAINAALFACSILGLHSPEAAKNLDSHRKEQTKKVMNDLYFES